MGQAESTGRHARCCPPGRSNVVLGGSSGRLAADYELGGRLADGQLGVIRVCTSKQTGERFACKSIQKSSLWSVGAVEEIRREISVMKLLSGHPNVVELKAVYEDQECVHLVMELCEGGELFDYITENNPVSEHEAAVVCTTLMEVLKHCHSRGVIHRDLKPENLLLSSKRSLFPLKVADFGLAVSTLPGDRLSDMAGSAYYIAPEVLEGDYGKEIDVWSAGVVLYILLAGVPPFWDETEEGIFNAIRGGQLDLHSGRWGSSSAEVKDLLRGMLCVNAKKRFTPEQVLNHKWIRRHAGSEGMTTFSKDPCHGSPPLGNASSISKPSHPHPLTVEEAAAAPLPADLTRSCKFRKHNHGDDPSSFAPDPPIKFPEDHQLHRSSLASNLTASSEEEISTANSSLPQPSRPKARETVRSGWEGETIVAEATEGRFGQEKERGRGGWKVLIEDDEESPMSLGCELNRLLFPSSSPTSTPCQPQCSCRQQPVY